MVQILFQRKLDYKLFSSHDNNRIIVLLFFRFVVGAAVVSFVNIIIILIGNSEKDVQTVVPVLEEKTNGAIMLY